MIGELASSAGGALLDGAGTVVVAFFVVLHTATAVLLIRALPELWRHWDPAADEALAAELGSAALPTVSVVVTGTATTASTVDRVHELLALRYPRHEVVLVHDGGASGALAALTNEFDLYHVPPAVLVNVPTGPVRAYFRSRRHGKLFVLDKAHVGRADDLNAALNASRFPYVLTLDVGIRLQLDALPRLMRPFLLGQRVAAVASAARIAEPRDARAGARAVEVLRELVFVRLGWNQLGGQPAAHDGLLMHRRDHLLELDGFRTGPADPELDLLIRLRDHLRAQHLSDAIPAIPDTVGWTSPSEGHERDRRPLAYRGRVEVVREHRATLFTTRHGLSRLLASLHLLAVEVIAPVMELAAYLLLAIALLTRGPGDSLVPLLLLAILGYSLLLSWWAIALDAVSGRGTSAREVARMAAFGVAEQVGYRQVLMLERLRAVWQVARGGHSGDSARLAPLADADAALPAADQARVR